MVQEKELRDRNWQPPPFDSATLDAVLINTTYRYTGYLPRIVSQGFRGPVYCSRVRRFAEDTFADAHVYRKRMYYRIAWPE